MACKLNSTLREGESRMEREKRKDRERVKWKREERKESDPTCDASNCAQESHQRRSCRQNMEEEQQIRH